MPECSVTGGRHRWKPFKREDVISQRDSITVQWFGQVRFRVLCLACGVKTIAVASRDSQVIDVQIVTTEQFRRKQARR